MSMKNRITHALICLTLAASMSVPAFAASRPLSNAELDLMARVIEHEAGNECLEGRIAVANVILNRVNDKRFPNTVSGVIYQKNQFPGATRSTPDATSRLAAKMAAEGTNLAPNAFWFNRASARGFSFAKRLYVIGNQAFYGNK